MKLFITIISSIILLSCSSKKETKEELFKKPIVINSLFPDSSEGKLHDEKYVYPTNPIFAGKYRFQDSIDINPESYRLNYDPRDIFEYSYSSNGDTLDFNGFELVADYKQSILFDDFQYSSEDELPNVFFPIFMVNSTKTDKTLKFRIFGIQETYEKRNLFGWTPIEARAIGFCSVGENCLTVHPNEFVVILMKKYEGEFSAKLRARVQNGPTTYVSNSYHGKMNESQTFVQDSSYIHRQLSDDEMLTHNLFCGAPIHDKKWKTKE